MNIITNIEKIDFRHSFATKICMWMLIMSALVYLIAFGGASWFASKLMLDDGHKKANLELDKAILYVNDKLNNVETASHNFADFWQWSTTAHATPADITAACRKFITSNPDILGVALCLEPSASPQQSARGYAPFVMRNGKGGFRTLDLARQIPYQQRDWYQYARTHRKSRWTQAFTDPYGNSVCSYCIPLFSATGKFIGTLAVDMSLNQLSDHVQSVKPYSQSFLTIMDRDFNFLAHPNKQMIIKTNASQLLKKSTYEVNESIFVDMKNQRRGIGAFGEGGQAKYLYYAPVKRAGWTITLECDKSEITAGMSAIRAQMVVISVLGILGLFFMSFFAMRKILRPIELYSRAALNIAEGNFHTHLPKMHDHNELWALGNSLDHMQHSLDEYIHQLQTTTKEKGRIESELNIASKIQMSMIPKIFPPYPDRDDVVIYGTLIPAKAVGGDLYDFFLRDEKLFFCVGDVSGKGVPASLVMAVTRSLLRIVAAQESRPDRIATSLNNSMSDMNDSNMFVTLFIGVLDLPTGRFRYCNAGHNAPVIINGTTHEVEMLSVKPNLPVAILPDMKFEMQETYITPGTSIFLYTDGVTEAENANHELFGEERMMQELKNMQDKSAREQIEGMLEAVHQHVDGAEQSDDLTMTVFKYKRHDCDTRFYRKISLHNDIRETSRIADFMDDIVGETGIDKGLASGLNLALEEAVVNVMNYAYPKDKVGNIVLEAYAFDNCLKFIVTDNGIPFDPTAAEEPDIDAPLSDRPVGGLGIFLVSHLMDKMEYKRLGDTNVLTLSKNLNS